MQTAAQEARDPEQRAANRTAAACSKALGTKMPRTMDASAISAARACPTTQ